MKKIIYITCFFLSILFITGSCKKFLDQKPLNSVATVEFLKSQKDVNTALAGIYASFQQEMVGDGTGMTGNYFAWGEMRSDNFDANGQYATSAYKQLALNGLTSGTGSSNWTGLYRTIGRCNFLIKNMPQAVANDATITTTMANTALAQAYAMRALCYYDIIRIWGDPVVWLEPYTDHTVADQRPRSPKDSVFTNVVLPDIQKAYDLIQKGQTPNVWTIGEGAICAIAADMNMWRSHDGAIQPKYDKVITWIQNLLKAKSPTGKVYGGNAVTDLEPTATWKNLFLNPAQSSESIWSINWDNAYNGCACLAVTWASSNNIAMFDSSLQANWKKSRLTDMRCGATIDTTTGLGHADKLLKYFNMNGKFVAPTGVAAKDVNVYLTMYRLGDVYLTYAEALNKMGDSVNSVKYLNFIRTRASMTAGSLPAYANGDPLINAANRENTILNERRYELYGEGKRWWDLVRTRKVNEVMDPILMQRQRRAGADQTGFGSNTDKILWPLYRTLKEDNKSLIQNPSYD